MHMHRMGAVRHVTAAAACTLIALVITLFAPTAAASAQQSSLNSGTTTSPGAGPQSAIRLQQGTWRPHSVWPSLDACFWRGETGYQRGEWVDYACQYTGGGKLYPWRLYVYRWSV